MGLVIVADDTLKKGVDVLRFNRFKGTGTFLCKITGSLTFKKYVCPATSGPINGLGPHFNLRTD